MLTKLKNALKTTTFFAVTSWRRVSLKTLRHEVTGFDFITF